MKTLLSASALLLGSFAATSALALPSPPVHTTPLDDPSLIPAPVMIATGAFDCTSGPAKAQYDQGFHVNYLSIWAGWVGGGMERADVTNFVNNSAAIATSAINSGIAAMDPSNPFHTSLACRLWGSLAGVEQATVDVIAEAVDSCSADGGYVGKFWAHIYCEQAEAFGPMAPVALVPRTSNECADVYQPICDGAFSGYVDAYTTTGMNACKDLYRDLDPAYTPGHDSFAHNQCTY